MKTISAVVTTALLASACGLMPPEPKNMYAGASRPIEQVAVLSEGARGWLHVISVDGQYVVDPVLGGAPFTMGLRVLPGSRVVKVRYYNVDGIGAGMVNSSSSEAQLTVDAKAGHTYVLRGRRGSVSYEFWFEDKGLGYNGQCLTPDAYTRRFIRGESVAGC